MTSGRNARISNEFRTFRKKEKDKLQNIFRGLNISEVQIDRLIPDIMLDYKIDIGKEILKRKNRI